MNTQKKKTIKIIPIFEMGICIIFLMISLLIQDTPYKPTYTYTNNRIITHSWHDYYDTILAIIFFLIAITTILCIAVWMIEKIKSKEKILRNILSAILSFFFCFVTLMISDIIVVGFWTNDDYSPSYYKFSDNKHTIVIEERSFLLYGGGTIYQIKDDDNAVIIHTFNIDDGGRNNGHYDINWYDDYAEITYHTFNTQDSKCTDKIVFVN